MAEINGLNGQWIGDYTDQSSGRIIADFDDLGSMYEGYAYVNPSEPGIPSSFVILRIPKGATDFELTGVEVRPVDVKTQQPDFTGTVGVQFPNVTFPKTADVKGRWSATELAIEWKTDQGVSGSTVLPRSRSGAPSVLSKKEMSWSDFKSAVGGLEDRRFLFRGQERPWRLRTAFHRAGRANLYRFTSGDIPALHRYLSARTRHVFNLNLPAEMGSFVNLAQHHGYPTPLFDWTYSPYVAAFFAFRRLTTEQTNNAQPKDVVRIFQFDQRLWRETFSQRASFFSISEHVSILDPLAIDNERMIPQQACVSITNVDDVETYIARCEAACSHRFLDAIDIPVVERDAALKELRFMGITAGSMFPGLDGACEELRSQFFRD